MSRRLIVSVCLAVVVVSVLGTRVYDTFRRTRVRIVMSAQTADAPAMIIEVPPQARLSGQPTAVILRLRGTPEPIGFTVALDGRVLARETLPAGRDEVRIDTSVASLPGSLSTLTLTASRPGWTLTSLELANIHGYSGGLASLVIVPRDRTPDAVVPAWLLVPLLIVLIAVLPRLDWPAGRSRHVHRAAVGLVLLLFAAALLAHRFTPYAVLISLPTFLLCATVLYAEPLVRAGRGLAANPVEAGQGEGPPLPRWRQILLRTGALPRIPWWISALDAACLLLSALLIRSLLEAGRAVSAADDEPTSRAWLLAASLALLVVIRHSAWSALPLLPHAATRIRSAWNSEALRAAWPPFVTSRLIVLITGYVAVFTIGFEDERPWRALNNDWLDLYARWDAGWYFQIASRGYPTHFNPERMSEVAFFPALPLVMRGGALLLDINYWAAGILAVVVAFLWGLTYLYRLARLDLPADQARAALMFLAFYPFAFCYSAVLTESLFLLAAAGAFYHFRQHALVKAGLFGLLAGLLRPNGFLLSIPLALIALLAFAGDRGWLPGRRTSGAIRWPVLARQLAAASLPVVGMAAYAAYIGSMTGNPLAWIEVQQAWGRATAEGLNTVEARRALIETQGLSAYARSYTIEIIEAGAAFFAIGAVWPIVRRFGLAYGVFVLICVLPPLISMGSVSLGRYTAPLFPIFLWLGAAVPPERRPYWIAVFAAGQALLAALFFTWRPPY